MKNLQIEDILFRISLSFLEGNVCCEKKRFGGKKRRLADLLLEVVDLLLEKRFYS